MEKRCVYCKFYVPEKPIFFGLGYSYECCILHHFVNERYADSEYTDTKAQNNCIDFKKHSWRYLRWKYKKD